MSEINCYIPIKLRITGRPSDSQLDQLGDALIRALAARMELAERVISNGHSSTAVGAADLREPFLSHRYHPERTTYTIPSYNGGGAPNEVPAQSPLAADSGISVTSTQAEGGFTVDQIANLISAHYTATNGLPDSIGVHYGVYLTMRGKNTPSLHYLLPGNKVRSLRIAHEEKGQSVVAGYSGGNYTLQLRPHSPGQLYQGAQFKEKIRNPENLDVTINFFVPAAPGVIEVTVAGPRRYHLYPRLSIVRVSDEARLTAGAETAYLAEVEIWRIDEDDKSTPVPGLAWIYAFISYEWTVWSINRQLGGAEQRVLVGQTKTRHGFLTHKWETDGEYEIECAVTVNYEDISPRPVKDKRRDSVIKLEAKMAQDLATLEKQESLPGAEEIWARSARSLLEAARTRLLKAEIDPKANEAAIRTLREAVKDLEKQIANQTAEGPYPLRAIFTERRTGQTCPISLFVGPALKPDDGYAHTWKLIDLTYPAAYRTHTGNGQTAGEAIRAAFEAGRSSFRGNYPPGRILAHIAWPGMSNYGLRPFDFGIETESWQRTAFEWFSLGASALGMLGMAAAIVIPPTSVALTTIIIASTMAGGTVSAINIIERIKTNSFKWDRETAVDMVNIAAVFTTVGGVAVRAASRGATAITPRTLAAGQEIAIGMSDSLSKLVSFRRGILYMDLANNVGNGFLIAYDTYAQLRDVDVGIGDSTLAEYQRIYGLEEGERRWEVERITRIIGVLARAAVNGYLTWVSLRDTSKALSESQKALEELSLMTNPESSWSLAMSYRQSGKTTQSSHLGATDADLPRVIINPDAAGKTPRITQIDRSKLLEMRHPESRAESSRLILDRGKIEETRRLLQEGKLTLSSAGENPRIIIWRGTAPEYIHGISRSDHDLGNGLYLTLDRGLGVLYAQERRAEVQRNNPGSPGLVLEIEVSPGELGRVLDFYYDKKLRGEWEAYLASIPGGTGLRLIEGRLPKNYYPFFQQWLKSKGMDETQFDTISGPEYIRGGNQIVIRDKDIRERLMEKSVEVMRLHEPLVPTYPDPDRPIAKELWNKLKQ